MLSLLVFLPLAAAAVLALARRLPHATARWVWVAISAVEVILVAWMWLGYKPGAGQVGS